MKTLRRTLAQKKANVLIVGCGRWLMGDDQIGLLAASRLAGRLGPGVTVETVENPDCALTLEAHSCDLLVLIDAAHANSSDMTGADVPLAPGRIIRLDGQDAHLLGKPKLLDTHSFSVRDFLQLAAALEELPRNVWIYAVVGQSFERSEKLSPLVAAALPRLLDRVSADVAEFCGHSLPRPESGVMSSSG